jgi:glycerol-3-phosphate acyltransferase PlsX
LSPDGAKHRRFIRMKIAVDAMGGDLAPASPVAGAVEALHKYTDIEVILVGDRARIEEEFAKLHIKQPKRLTIHHASQVVEMADSAIDAIRRKKDSSISRAVELLAEGGADALVSAGHTGAFVAASKVKLRTLPGVDRPGIATVMPTETSLFLLIDAGANVDSEPKHLLQFGIMGSVYSREVLGRKNPRVGLMSIGSEASKGNELTREAYKELSRAKINFIGNVEGHDLFNKAVDVVVCDGFVGNVILKTSESLAGAIFAWLRRELRKDLVRSFGALMAKEAFYAIRRRTNTEEYGGMPLLGVNGICIKAHGNSTPKAIKNAIRVAREAVAHQVNPLIVEEIAQHEGVLVNSP